ncbi:MAG: shikimate kinase [Dehalococcoidales bacterium]|nr:shikimate kinase [Dehalococcoidales bacterium]
MKNNSVVLIGMAGAGKSTVGVRLADVLGFSFIDLDVYIREKENSSIQDIINKQGEEVLLELEQRCMFEIELNRRVIAPGGSVVYLSDLMAYLERNAVLVYLEDLFENLEKRIKNAPERGIVGLKSKTLRQVYDERAPLYAAYADCTINLAGKSPEHVVEEIACYLHNHWNNDVKRRNMST